jgi:hypothetical protein
VKTLESFDFAFQPSLKREQIESLHELNFIERKENVVLLGPPGVGKTHLALSLTIAAAQRGRHVYYGTLIDLITSLEEAQAAGHLARRLTFLTHPSLLVVDEIGYLPINHAGAVLFFQLMNRRYERASTVLTSNKGFEEWGEAFGTTWLRQLDWRRCAYPAQSTHGQCFRARAQKLRPDAGKSGSQRRLAAAGVYCVLSVAYRTQLDRPARHLQDCAQSRSSRSRYLLDLHGLMAYKDAPALRHTLHRHHGFAVIQDRDRCNG